MFMEKILPLLNTISLPKSDEEEVEKPKKYHKGTENVLRRKHPAWAASLVILTDANA